MNSFIPREKLGKRARKAQDHRKRILWDGINPVTRKTENKKRYNRKKSPRWYNDDSAGIFISAACCASREMMIHRRA